MLGQPLDKQLDRQQQILDKSEQRQRAERLKRDRHLFKSLATKQREARERMKLATNAGDMRYEQGQEHAYRQVMTMARELEKQGKL